MAPPKHLSTDAKIFWMERYMVLTEKRVTRLREVMEFIQFKKGNPEEHKIDIKKCVAYVFPEDETRTVYLCPLFWEAPQRLERDSQPGTLIHEASHFMGTDDLAYGADCEKLEFGCRGAVVKGAPDDKAKTEAKEVLKHMRTNADNYSLEFEVTLSHKQTYTWVEGRKQYPCCGETAEHSVCKEKVSRDFLQYYSDKKEQSNAIKGQKETILKEIKALHPYIEKLLKTGKNMLVSLELKRTIQMCNDHLESILKECGSFNEKLQKFSDFKCSDGDNFASGLSSYIEAILAVLLPVCSSPVICCRVKSDSSHKPETDFLQSIKTSPLTMFSDEVKKFEIGMNSIVGIDMFDAD